MPPLDDHLVYLLKHAQLRLSELSARALDPLGISGRECAVLITIDDAEPLSQQQAADRMRIDRTTMVALVDELEDKGLLERRPDPADRRRNVIALTKPGRRTLRRARAATAEAESRVLSETQRATLRGLLRGIAFPDG